MPLLPRALEATPAFLAGRTLVRAGRLQPLLATWRLARRLHRAPFRPQRAVRAAHLPPTGFLAPHSSKIRQDTIPIPRSEIPPAVASVLRIRAAYGRPCSPKHLRRSSAIPHRPIESKPASLPVPRVSTLGSPAAGPARPKVSEPGRR